MTVSTTTSRADYTGNGVTTAFTVPFYFLDNSHVQVLRTQISTGVITTLTLTTDYTVSGAGVSGGGTVTMVTAPTTDQKLSILRNVPLTQLVHYVPNDPFPAATHEQALDQLTMEVQQVSEVAGRALTLPANTPSGSVSSSLPTPAANKLIGWNATATGLQNIDQATLATIVAFGTAKYDLFSGNGATTAFTLTASPGALANLDVSISGVTQRPGTDYTWTSGTTITFTSAPPSGTNNVLVRYLQGLPQGTSDSASAAFIQSGTGAVSRVAQDKMRERVSVKDFGAVGDGVANDTAAIQAAMTAALVAGKTLFVPAGTYLLNSQLNININNDPTTRGFVMEGEGENSKFVINHTANGIELVCSPSFAQFKAAIRGVYFTGQSASPARLIHNNGACNTVISDCYFMAATVTVGCVVNDNAYGLSLQGCVFNGITGAGVLYAGTPSLTTYSYVNSIIDCDFGALSQAITVQGLNALYVANTVIEQCTTGVYVNAVGNSVPSFNMTFDTCWFERNTNYDLQFSTNTSYWAEASIRNTQFSGTSPTYQAHIDLGAKGKVTIDGCTAAGNTVIVSGSAEASALLIRATNFTQSGTFAWTELQGGGRFISPFMANNASGDLKLLSGKFYSLDGTTPVSNATTTEIATLPNVPFGTFIITISIIAGDATNWQTVGLVNTQATSSIVTILRQAAQVLNLTMSGLTVQAYENSGAGATIYWNITRIA
jgi:Pectate lyase superfamily protein